MCARWWLRVLSLSVQNEAFVYWWFNSGVMRISFKVSKAILWLTVFLQARGSTLPLFTCICTCPVYNQVCNSCGCAAGSMRHLLIDRYRSTNGQSPALCLSLNHTVSFIECRAAAGQRCERDARLSVPVVLQMDELCCALALEGWAKTKEVERGRMSGLFWCKTGEHNYL